MNSAAYRDFGFDYLFCLPPQLPIHARESLRQEMVPSCPLDESWTLKTKGSEVIDYGIQRKILSRNVIYRHLSHVTGVHSAVLCSQQSKKRPVPFRKNYKHSLVLKVRLLIFVSKVNRGRMKKFFAWMHQFTQVQK